MLEAVIAASRLAKTPEAVWSQKLPDCVLAAGRLPIDEQPEPILATEFAGIGGIVQLEKGIGHSGEALQEDYFAAAPLL